MLTSLSKYKKPKTSLSLPVSGAPSLAEAFIIIAGLPKDVSGTLRHLLLWLTWYTATKGDVTLTNEELAAAVGVSRATIVRELHVGQTRGFIKTVSTRQEGRINWNTIRQLADQGSIRLILPPKSGGSL